MFFLGLATFYVLGDKLAHAYTFSRLALWIIIGLGIIELIGERQKVKR